MLNTLYRTLRTGPTTLFGRVLLRLLCYNALWLLLSGLALQISDFDVHNGIPEWERSKALSDYWQTAFTEAFLFSALAAYGPHRHQRLSALLLVTATCCVGAFGYHWCHIARLMSVTNPFDPRFDFPYVYSLASIYVSQMLRWCLCLGLWIFGLLFAFDRLHPRYQRSRLATVARKATGKLAVVSRFPRLRLSRRNMLVGSALAALFPLLWALMHPAPRVEPTPLSAEEIAFRKSQDEKVKRTEGALHKRFAPAQYQAIQQELRAIGERVMKEAEAACFQPETSITKPTCFESFEATNAVLLEKYERQLSEKYKLSEFELYVLRAGPK